MTYLDEHVTIELPAPLSWKKVFYPELASAAPRMPKVMFEAPTGEKIRSRRDLKKYLKAHPGSPDISEFDWTNGETPRRSPRILQKMRAATTPTPDEELLPMKKRRSSLAKEGSAENDEEAREGVAVAEENVVADENGETENAERVVTEIEEGEKAEAEAEPEAEAEAEAEAEVEAEAEAEAEAEKDEEEPMEVDTSEVETKEEPPKAEDLKDTEMKEPLGVVAEENGEEKPAEEETENKDSVVAAEANGEQNATSDEPNLVADAEAGEKKTDGEPKLDADAEVEKVKGAEEADEKKAEAAAAVIEEEIDDLDGEDFDVLV